MQVISGGGTAVAASVRDIYDTGDDTAAPSPLIAVKR
jgi:hypothetical protein